MTGVGKIQGYRLPLVTRIPDPGWLPFTKYLANFEP